MEDTMRVMELLDEIEDIVEDATGVPLTNKIMIDSEDILQVIKEIRIAMPDDIQQAKWIRDERDRILAEAKSEYERIIREAKKQADYLVETDDITARATKLSNEILEDAQINSKVFKMKTYDYIDKILYDVQCKMDDLNVKYFGEMYTTMENTFTGINQTLTENREELKTLAYKTQNDVSTTTTGKTE